MRERLPYEVLESMIPIVITLKLSLIIGGLCFSAPLASGLVHPKEKELDDPVLSLVLLIASITGVFTVISFLAYIFATRCRSEFNPEHQPLRRSFGMSSTVRHV